MSRAVTYILLIGLGFLFLIPFLWTVSTALKDNQDSFQFPPQWIPSPPLWENFAKAWTALPFNQWVLNTLFITVVTTVFGLLSGSLVAYGFSRFQFKGRGLLFGTMLATMMLPGKSR